MGYYNSTRGRLKLVVNRTTKKDNNKKANDKLHLRPELDFYIKSFITNQARFG